MKLTLAHLDAIAGKPVDRANAGAVLAGLDAYPAGIDRAHRLSHYLAQIMHESGCFRYDQEIASGAAYEGRTDLGNIVRGDGTKFKGRTAVQLTGRSNYRQFRDWCAAAGLNPPNFEAGPEAVLTDPWEGLAPIWYWTTRGLNGLADHGDLKAITRKINGGYNGLADRQRWYVRAALVLLGYGPKDVQAFQQAAGLAADGIPGPQTLAALHSALRVAETGPLVATEIPPRQSFWDWFLALVRRV